MFVDRIKSSYKRFTENLLQSLSRVLELELTIQRNTDLMDYTIFFQFGNKCVMKSVAKYPNNDIQEKRILDISVKELKP